LSFVTIMDFKFHVKEISYINATVLGGS